LSVEGADLAGTASAPLGENGAETAGSHVTTRAVGAAAVILMAGNLVGSVLGFARGAVIARVFGANVHTDAFFAASIVPQMFYDLTIGAAVSAALIPTFSEIWNRKGRTGLAHTAGAVLTLAWIVLAVLIAILIVLARPLMSLLLLGYQQHLRAGALDEAVPIARILVLSLFFLGTSAVLLSTLYAMSRFRVSAFAGSCYHLGIIAGAVLLARPLGILALPVGAIAGAAAQASVQVPSLLRHVGRVRVHLEITPDVRRILRLYAPVAVGLLVSIAGQVIDLIFKSHLGEGPITWMQIATTLVQFPIGIAAAAMSFAVLPSISADAATGRVAQFKETLTLGMRLVLFLSIPAAIGYLALANPIVALLFQHGKFTAHDTSRTATALIGYAIQIPFVGIDQLLIFAFYARRNTVTPMLIGVVGVGVYVVSALILAPELNVLGLALANTIQNSTHGLILLGLLIAAIGTLEGTGLAVGLSRICASAAIMGAGVVAAAVALHAHLHGSGLRVWAPEVLLPMALGLVLYVGASAALRSPELGLFWDLARRRPLSGKA
jgi:putative peptidoglycan lipid II flippase